MGIGRPVGNARGAPTDVVSKLLSVLNNAPGRWWYTCVGLVVMLVVPAVVVRLVGKDAVKCLCMIVKICRPRCRR